MPVRKGTEFPDWTFLAYSSRNDGVPAYNPYWSNANAWYRHIGYDLSRRKDLVLYETSASRGSSSYMEIYETSSAIPTIRGSKVWQGTNGDAAAGRNFRNEGGNQIIQIPWLGCWWVIQYNQTPEDGDQVWGFEPTASPANGGSSTAAGFAVTVPSAIHTRAKFTGGNLKFVVDHMNQRVFAYQVDTDQSAEIADGVSRYPLLIWEVNPSAARAGDTSSWAPVSIPVALKVAGYFGASSAAKVNLVPMAYYGGHKFMYFDPITSSSSNWGSVFVNTSTTDVKRTGGFYIREIDIPKASMPRTTTWTERTWSGAAASGTPFSRQKHVEMSFNSLDGKMYCFGGDHSWGPENDGTLPSGSYNNQVLSFTPESGTDLTVEENACPLSGATSHPIRVDENGWQYRSAGEFFMMAGYSDANWTNNCGWATRAAWEAAGGNNFGRAWKWTAAAGWSVSGPFVAKAGFSGRTFIQGEEHCRRWYYDSGADKLLAAAFGYGGYDPDNSLQSPTIQIVDATTTSGNHEFTKYHAGVCYNGLGGDVTKLPDGRPHINTLAGATSMWRSDRAAVDPATGHVYVYQPATGDVFRIHTRSEFWDYGGTPAARVDWVFRAIGSHTRSYNLAHFIWAKNALWMLFQSATYRLRMFSWASGETAPTEHTHELPVACMGACVAKYTVGADERICVIGRGPDEHTFWSTNVTSRSLKYYTVELA